MIVKFENYNKIKYQFKLKLNETMVKYIGKICTKRQKE